ncbi:MAG: DUF6340 family protein [Bacteroidales bacterium]|jgi:hypothetical protein|nr:DUF6340 family protein [Bacteroidales bacterium]
MKQGIKKLIQVTASLFFALIVFSCVQTRTLTIEIPETAAKNLPENIQSLTIVNRTVDEKYHDHNTDSLQNIFYRSEFKLDTVIYDLQAVDTMLKALGELLFESGRYDFVIPENRFLEFNENKSLNYEMTWDEARSLCERFNTNAVLSIDHYKTRIKTSISNESFYNPLTNGLFNAVLAQMQVNYEVLIRVYDPVSEKIILNEVQHDSLLWEDTYTNLHDLVNRFTSVKQALTETSIVVALDLSEKISTNWNREQRNIFVQGKNEFEQSGNLALNGDWLQAIVLWGKISESSKSKTKKSRAEFNVAVGYEMLGDIDQAISWALKSYNTMFHPLTYEYIEKLQKRKNELQNH